MGFWWPRLYFETRISFHSFGSETWKHECLYLFQTLKYSLYSEPQITVNQLSNIYTFLVGYLIFWKFILETKENGHTES